MSSGMFRGKESSNRIELSRLVQELLNFGVSGPLVDGGWGWLRGAPHTFARTLHAHIHVHDNFNCKWQPPLSLGIPYDVICVHVCMHVHVHMCRGHPLTTPTPIHSPPTPQGVDPLNQSKFNST